MREVDNLHLILLNIGCSVHNGDWNWKSISSPFIRLFYVREGYAKIKFSDYTQELRPGYMYLIPSFTLHSYECDTFFSHIYIHIYEKQSVLEELNFPLEIETDTIDLLLVNRLLDINKGRELKQFDPKTYDNPPMLLRNIAEEAHQPEYKVLETKGILLQLLSRFLQYATPKSEVSDERIMKVLNFIRKNINKKIKVNHLSDICNLTEDHFIRLFKKELRCTPIQYINQKKIEKAQLMLIVENIPIKDIAYNLSFENISYFNRLFKQITQHTPTQYCEVLKGK
jgi:AraC-like DNA-binding protein